MDIYPFDLNTKVRSKNDYRDLHTLSIDPAGAYEIDDALSIETTQTGYRLGIHIADVAARLPIGSKLDKQAKEMIVSRYSPYTPMLPKNFTRELSLNEGENRLARSVFLEINSDCSIAKVEFIPTKVRLDANLAYENFQEDLKNPQHKKTLKNLLRLRTQFGFNGYSPRGFFYDGEDGVSGNMVAFYMVLANHHTAKYLAREGIKSARRSYYRKKSIVPFLHHSAQRMVESEFAFYTTEIHPHEFLGLDHYMHSTSPIRRYPDIMVQRQFQEMDGVKEGYQNTRAINRTLHRLNEGIYKLKTAA